MKILMFDLVGVLVGEKHIEMTSECDKIERLFGKNISDEEFYNKALNIINSKEEIDKNVTYLMKELYYIKDKNLFFNLKEKYPHLKIIIATNHVTMIKEFITNNFEYINDIYISAEIEKIKPNKDFYEYIINKERVLAEEILFLDDNYENILTASDCSINTIHVKKNTNLMEEINKFL